MCVPAGYIRPTLSSTGVDNSEQELDNIKHLKADVDVFGTRAYPIRNGKNAIEQKPWR